MLRCRNPSRFQHRAAVDCLPQTVEQAVNRTRVHSLPLWIGFLDLDAFPASPWTASRACVPVRVFYTRSLYQTTSQARSGSHSGGGGERRGRSRRTRAGQGGKATSFLNRIRVPPLCSSRTGSVAWRSADFIFAPHCHWCTWRTSVTNRPMKGCVGR